MHTRHACASEGGLTGVIPTGKYVTNLSANVFEKLFDAKYIERLGETIATTLGKVKSGLDKGGSLTEEIVAAALKKEGYNVSLEIGKYGSTNGYDVVAWKGTLESPTEMLIIEAKQFKQGKVLAEFDDIAALPGYDAASGVVLSAENLKTGLPTQMSMDWIFEHVANQSYLA